VNRVFVNDELKSYVAACVNLWFKCSHTAFKIKCIDLESLFLLSYGNVMMKSRMRGAIPPFPHYALMEWCAVKAQGHGIPKTWWKRLKKSKKRLSNKSRSSIGHLESLFLVSYCNVMMSLDSSVYSAGLRARLSGVRVPTGAGNFSLHHRFQTYFGAHPASCTMDTRGSFPGDKAAGAWSWPLTSI
jgi:hypothetical protein